MPCCSHCQGADQLFDVGVARSDLNSYRRKGPSRQTKLLLSALREAGVEGATLIDIGGGVGAIQHELLADGVRSAVHVDASTAYLGASQEEAEKRGHRQRVTYLHGNFVDLAPEIQPADVVTLDRVVCCYPDMPGLVGASAARAQHLYGLVYPRDAGWMKLGNQILNLYLWVRRNPFRTFVHSAAKVDAAIRAQGLTPRYHRNAGLWQVVVYGRD
ncbi:MAG: class I SAM-dependent methyltransferase [Anaerolineae bacterium]